MCFCTLWFVLPLLPALLHTFCICLVWSDFFCMVVLCCVALIKKKKKLFLVHYCFSRKLPEYRGLLLDNIMTLCILSELDWSQLEFYAQD